MQGLEIARDFFFRWGYPLLLSGDFTPFWKWLAHEFRKLEGAAQYVPLMEGLLRSRDLDEQADLVRTICRHVYRDLRDVGAITGHVATPHTMPLFGAQLELKARAEAAKHSTGGT